MNITLQRNEIPDDLLDFFEEVPTASPDFWHLSSQPFAEAHFATFPPEVPRRCISAGTSERGVCGACGAQWRRIVEKSLQETNRNPAPNKKHLKNFGERAANMTGDGFVPNRTITLETIGFAPSCQCDAGEPVPATVLDIFGGAMTTPMVANQLGRKAIAIELNPEYVAIGVKRLQHNAAQELLPMAYDAPETPQPAQAQQGLFSEESN